MNKHTYPITASSIPAKSLLHYKLWDGEQHVTVHQTIGAHGFYSACIVVEYCDSPMLTLAYDGYVSGTPRAERLPRMAEWIAANLNKLATGKSFAVGTFSDIEEAEPFEVYDIADPF